MNEIRLRAVEPEDVDFMLECESDRAAATWSDYRAPFSRHQLMSYALTYDADPFDAGQLRLIAETTGGIPVGIADTSEGNVIGIADLYDIDPHDLRAYVGITIHPAHRRHGYGLKTLESLISYSRDKLGLRMLAAKISEQNPAALALFRVAGFLPLCLLPHWHKIGSHHHNIHLLYLPL